jgi:hypothetical protein
LTNPAAPESIATFSGEAWALGWSNNLLVASAGQAGVVIRDMTDPNDPQILSTVPVLYGTNIHRWQHRLHRHGTAGSSMRHFV